MQTTTRRRLAAMALLAALALPAGGQNEILRSDIAPVLSGKAFPLTLRLRDLGGDWRRISVRGPGEAPGGVDEAYARFVAAMFGGTGGPMYYTKGQTVTIGGQPYLVAYRPKTRPVDQDALMRAQEPPQPEKLTPETVLSLSLLNLRATASFDDIQEFHLEDEIGASATGGLAEAASAARLRTQSTQSLTNLKQLGLALITYAQDYDETLPPMQDAATAKKALLPYIENEAIFVHPGTRQPYRPNPILSGKKLAHIAEPAAFVAFYEADPVLDGMLSGLTRGILFLDGHAKRVTEAKWRDLARASKIKLPEAGPPGPASP